MGYEMSPHGWSLAHTVHLFLRCCLSKECVHPLCSVLDQLPSWYEGGPPLSFIPLPVQEPKRPPGNLECPECKGVCNGHYLKPDNHLLNLRQCTRPVCMPPSDVIKTREAKTDSKLSSWQEMFSFQKKTFWSRSEHTDRPWNCRQKQEAGCN